LSQSKSNVSRIVIAVVVIVIVIAAAFVGYRQFAPTSGTSTSTSVSVAKAPIRIGLLNPLTGSSAFIGTDLEQGARLAAADINAQGGVNGMQIQIFSADEGNGGTSTINAYNQLVHGDNCGYIIGPTWSGDMLTLIPYISRDRVITISGLASLDSLYDPVLTNYTNYKWIFRMQATDAQMGVDLFSFVGQVVHAKTMVIVGQDFLYAHEIAQGGLNLANKTGVKVLATDFYSPSSFDLNAEIMKIASLQPQAVLLISTGQDVLTFINQYKQNPTTAKIPLAITNDTPLGEPSAMASYLQAHPGAANYVTYHGPWYTQNLTSRTASFVQEWKTKFGVYPNMIPSARGYDIVSLIANAILRAGSTNPDAVVSALESSNFTGVSGIISFDKGHSLIVSEDKYVVPLVQWQNGEPVTIWPNKFATGKYVPPASGS